MTSAVLIGSTGQVGSQILPTLLAHPALSTVYAYTRRPLPNPTASTKLHAIELPDLSQWPGAFPGEAHPKLFFSGLATTRAIAGGLEPQRKIDVDANIDMARKARDSGVDIYVLISAAGASTASMFAYNKMKGELEDAVTALGFKHTIILRPGMIVGNREKPSLAEGWLKGLAKGMQKVVPSVADVWSQDAAVIARAAVRAGVKCLEGEKEGGVWVLGQGDIVGLGKAP